MGNISPRTIERSSFYKYLSWLRVVGSNLQATLFTKKHTFSKWLYVLQLWLVQPELDIWARLEIIHIAMEICLLQFTTTQINQSITDIFFKEIALETFNNLYSSPRSPIRWTSLEKEKSQRNIRYLNSQKATASQKSLACDPTRKPFELLCNLPNKQDQWFYPWWPSFLPHPREKPTSVFWLTIGETLL